MSSTPEKIPDLRPGDTLELTFAYEATKLTVRGVFPEITDWHDNYLGGPYTLTVVSRAPRKLYVNSDRTEPVPGDVVRDADDGAGTDTWAAGHDAVGVQAWRHTAYGIWCLRKELPDRLRLLVDGETGQVVPS